MYLDIASTRNCPRIMVRQMTKNKTCSFTTTQRAGVFGSALSLDVFIIRALNGKLSGPATEQNGEQNDNLPTFSLA
jgi:hypothetical protein